MKNVVRIVQVGLLVAAAIIVTLRYPGLWWLMALMWALVAVGAWATLHEWRVEKAAPPWARSGDVDAMLAGFARDHPQALAEARALAVAGKRVQATRVLRRAERRGSLEACVGVVDRLAEDPANGGA